MSTDAVDNFVREARTYCRFVEKASALSLAERLRAARERLLGLYSAALSLPPVEPDDLDASGSPHAPTDWPGFGEDNKPVASVSIVTGETTLPMRFARYIRACRGVNHA